MKATEHLLNEGSLFEDIFSLRKTVTRNVSTPVFLYFGENEHKDHQVVSDYRCQLIAYGGR